MDDAKKQLIDKLQTATNVLVTVSRDPSVDQLAACIGLTLLLNKKGKHTAAVFSGNVPSTLEFLKPEETLEKNTDSLRDFIISLDKSKADKLRYKVENDVVRIFITPYKTSISQADLEFSEGDFNVDVVIALGVQQQQDLDEAITAHGRILHDATVASINLTSGSELGTINWNDTDASSLSELVTELAQLLDSNLIDNQTATALLTGVVAATDRFSNEKTSAQTMSVSASLMAAGANQQLVVSKLQEAGNINASVDLSENAPSNEDGTMAIDHTEAPEVQKSDVDLPMPPSDPQDVINLPNPDVDSLPSEASTAPELADGPHPPKLITEPPTLGSKLTANSESEPIEGTSDPLSLPSSEAPQLLDHKQDVKIPAATMDESTGFAAPSEFAAPSVSSASPTPAIAPVAPSTPSTPPAQEGQPAWVPETASPISIDPSSGQFSSNHDSPAVATTPDTPTTQPPAGPNGQLIDSSTPPINNGSTLADLEKAVDSPHVQANNLDNARDEIDRAINGSPAAAGAPESPIEALNAQPLGDDLHPEAPLAGTPDSSDQPTDPNAPPPVPPPIPFQFDSQQNGQQPPQP